MNKKNEYRTLKAKDIRDGYVEDFSVSFSKEFDGYNKLSLREVAKLYEVEAENIVEGLLDYAPGGLVDAILRDLLRRKASLLAVPFVDNKEDV